MILRGQIDPKHQYILFFKILSSCYFSGGQRFFGDVKARISPISKSMECRIKMFSPVDLATLVSYLPVIHYVALISLFFELFSETLLHEHHAGVSWPNHVHYLLHAPKLRLSEPVHALPA